MTADSDNLPIIVVGAGVAGITAALDLSCAGRSVHLIEKSAVLGGQVARLDKLYPTDHCAFCPLWTQSRLCLAHPLIMVHTHSCVDDITRFKGRIEAVIKHDPNFIDADLCTLCGRCKAVCPENAVHQTIPHALPRSFLVNATHCTGCGRCVNACPVNAIDLKRKEEKIKILAENIIWATGFADSDISVLPEFGYGTHPNIITALEFETLTAEAGKGRGKTITPEGKVPHRIAFIQCAGARDQRKFPFCSAVCCMHALKQARWVKRRNPDIDCVIFFTDMRTEGRNYYTYYQDAVQEQSIELVRGRPGLICPLPAGDGLAVRYENTLTGTLKMEHFDLVVLNGALTPCPKKSSESAFQPITDDNGFTCDDLGQTLSCGFCRAPADVEMSAVQASSAAMKAYIMEKGVN